MKQSLPPGPPGPPIVHGVAMWTRPLASLERARAKYGKRFTVQFPFTPPFVLHSEPEHVKEIYTAPPDVLHPGEGARVLEPLVGANSVILLDGDAHMEQRKLMLPAFHGERMERLTDLVTRVTEEEIAPWERDEIELHPRLQALTLEIILRAVFGLDPGPRLDALRDALTELLAYGDSPAHPDPAVEGPEDARSVHEGPQPAGPLRGFLDVRDRIDALIAEQIDERRAEGTEDRDDVLAMLLEARHEDDGSEMSFEELRDELMTLLVAGHETTSSTLAWTFERIVVSPRSSSDSRRRPLPTTTAPYLTRDDPGDAAAPARAAEHRAAAVMKPITVGGWDYEPGCSLGGERLPPPPRPRDLPRPIRVPARAVRR